MSAKDEVCKIAKLVGVEVNGSRPDDPQILDDSAYSILLSRNSIAIGEAYMNMLWDCEDLVGFYTKLLENKVFIKKSVLSDPKLLLRGIFSNLQSRRRSFQVAEHHYDLGDDLYQTMLDKRMVYTCARWEGVETLAEAQEQKLKALCRKLELKPGDRVLDIGCGWGSFMKYAVEKYDVTCVGLTVSKGQTELGRKMCEGLPIEFIITDYRNYKDEKGFDHIVSVEMIEAVGPKNFRTYFEKAKALLKPNGTFALQAIIDNDAVPIADPWIDKYIFRNGVLPSLRQLETATRDLFVFENLENIGPDYDLTLMAWWNNFDSGYSRLSSANPAYDQRFYRMWKYYLQSCAAIFRAKTCNDWQILLRLAP